MKKIRIKIGNQEFRAILYDTPTAKEIIKNLPFSATSYTWGDEIYFRTPALTDLEPDAREVVKEGDLAYWPPMPAFCIFFGPTPVSEGFEPRASSKVNVFGRLEELNLYALKRINHGDEVQVELFDY